MLCSLLKRSPRLKDEAILCRARRGCPGLAHSARPGAFALLKPLPMIAAAYHRLGAGIRPGATDRSRACSSGGRVRPADCDWLCCHGTILDTKQGNRGVHRASGLRGGGSERAAVGRGIGPDHAARVDGDGLLHRAGACDSVGDASLSPGAHGRVRVFAPGPRFERCHGGSAGDCGEKSRGSCRIRGIVGQDLRRCALSGVRGLRHAVTVRYDVERQHGSRMSCMGILRRFRRFGGPVTRHGVCQ